jgi:Ca2+-binding EF-hand superfamily protein
MQAPIEVGSTIVERASRPSKQVVVSINQSSDMPPEKLQMLTDLFALADGDGSGAIDAKELGKLLSKFGDELPEAEVEAMMKTVDTDGSGTITLDELCVMMGPRLKDMGSRDDLKQAFAYIDTDGSGRVSRAEIKELLVKLDLAETMSDEKLALLFSEADPRGAGEIDVENFVELFTNGGLASKELSLAISLLCTVQTMRRSLQAVTGFALWGEVKEPAPHASTVFIFDYLCEKLADQVPHHHCIRLIYQ